MTTTDPTRRNYNSLTQAYEHFNAALFDGKLPPCLITLQRRNNSYGYFSSRRFVSADDPCEATDEVALNPAHFGSRAPAEVLATLVHDMTHVWQRHYGSPSRANYHNREFASRMKAVGLIPLDGKATGQKVRYGIEEGGAFERACRAFLANGPVLLYQDRPREGEEGAPSKKAASKTRYTCGACGANAWAKPDTALLCGTCNRELEAVGGKGAVVAL